MKTQVNIKLDTKIKKDAQRTAKSLGLSLSSVVNASLSQFVKNQELHLSVEPTMTPHLEALVKKAREDFKKGTLKGPFSSIKDLKDDLNC